MKNRKKTSEMAIQAANRAIVEIGWAPLSLLHRVNACAAVAKSVRAQAILSKMGDLLTTHIRGL